MNEVKDRDYSFYEDKYGIPAGTVVWYNSGSCYSRIGVNTLQAAKAVQRIAGMETANGGYMHGERLGTISALQQPDGGTHYDITC